MELGRYKLSRKLGSGGMGEVFLAHVRGAAGFEKPVALKRIYRHISADESYRRLFVREAKVTARLSHPNIVQVFDLGEEDGQLFIAMELVDGPSLAEILAHLRTREETLAPELAAVAAFDVLEALAYAQTVPDEDGVPLCLVHRDISPQNLLVQRAGGFVKLCDFGVAKGHGSARATQGKAVGKTAYIAPEQAIDDNIDGRADLYSLGAVMFEAVVGKPAQWANNLPDLAATLLHGESPRLAESNPDLPLPFMDLVDRALQRDRSQRYASAVEFRNAVERFLASGDPRAVRDRMRELACEIEDTVAAKVERETERGTERAVSGTGRWHDLAAGLSPVFSGITEEPTDRDQTTDRQPDTVVEPFPLPRSELPQPQPPQPPPRPRWVWPSLAVAAVVIIGSFFVALCPRDDRSAPHETVVVNPVDRVQPDATPTAVAPAAESEPANEPVHTGPMVEAEARPKPQPEPEPQPDKRRPNKARVGYLSLNVRPWARVVIDGVELSKPTPLRRHPLPPGRHTVVLRGPSGRTRTVSVVIRSGRTVTRILSFD